MNEKRLDFLRTAVRGGDFDADVCDGLLQALAELEAMQQAVTQAYADLPPYCNICQTLHFGKEHFDRPG